MSVVLFAASGWCGNEIRRRGIPPRPPGPEPWETILAAVAGVGMGYVVSSLAPAAGPLTRLDLAVTSLLAAGGGVVGGSLPRLGRSL